MANAQSGGASGGRPTRRQFLVGGALAAGTVAIAQPAMAATYRTATRAQHDQLPILWGYPFADVARRRLGVDGYEGDSYPGHRGVDYFTEPGSGVLVHAVADGLVDRVDYTGESAGTLGQYVRVAHDSGVYSFYGHLTRGSTLVKVGDRIGRGAPLGRTGWSGGVFPKASSSAHLHLSIQSNPGGNTLVWNPRWLVDDATLVGLQEMEEFDMPFLVKTRRGHIFTIAPSFLRHETSNTSVNYLRTVYPKYVQCKSDAQFDALLDSMAIPRAVPDSLRADGGGKSWTVADAVWRKVAPGVPS